MFNTDFIGIYDNALSSYHCKEIIKWIEKQDLVRGVTGGGEGLGVDTSKKDSWEVSGPTFDNKTYVSQLIKDSIYKHTPLYKEKWSREMYCIKQWHLYNDYNIQKYDPGGGYHILHCEQDGGPPDDVAGRMLVWMIYLNTVTDSGGTYFSSYNKTIRAKEGRLVIWPAFWTHCHKGVVSKSQTKYIATGWYNYVEEYN